MAFIKLHYKSGEATWINSNHIAAIERDKKGGTAVYFTANKMEMWLKLKETPEEIIRKIILAKNPMAYTTIQIAEREVE